MYSSTEENYLKALFFLTQANGEAGVNELSRMLDIKMPTVNSMMKKLADKKLVRYESYKPVRLSEKGKKEAALIIRKHRLTEMYLVEKMGFTWDQVHSIAEQVEHIRSPEFFDKMDELLEYPKMDPHGSPIPDKNGRLERLNLTKLSDCKVGDIVIFAAVLHSSDVFLKFLSSRGLKLGTTLTIKAVEAFDGTMTVSYERKKPVLLSRVACEKILVSPD